MLIDAALATSPELPFEIRQFKIEDPRQDEVLVKIVASGICHTDIAVKDQKVKLPLPMVLGHEGSGIVESIGKNVSGLAIGDHVVLSGDFCGHCKRCIGKLPSYCDEFVERNLTGKRIDGSSPLSLGDLVTGGRFVGQSSFASYSVVSQHSAIKIDDSYPLHLMGPLGCGLTTGVGTIIHALEVSEHDRIAIFGAGTVGLAAVMGSVLSNCSSIVVIDPINNRRELALELGATHVLDPGQDRVVEEILDITEGGADFSIEASGNPAAVKMSIECLARPGWCAQVGATPAQTFHSLDMDHLGFGRGIKGVVMGDAYAKEFVPYLAELHSQGKLPFEKLVKEYKFDDINLAIADSRNGDVIKPILIM